MSRYRTFAVGVRGCFDVLSAYHHRSLRDPANVRFVVATTLDHSVGVGAALPLTEVTNGCFRDRLASG